MNIILSRLGDYSKTNIPLMIFDGSHRLADAIWELADRRNRKNLVLASVAKPEHFIPYVLSLEFLSETDSVMIRHIENLRYDDQRKFAACFARLEPFDRGKFIFTTDDFEKIERSLKREVCQVKFYFDFRDGNVVRSVAENILSAELTEERMIESLALAKNLIQ